MRPPSIVVSEEAHKIVHSAKTLAVAYEQSADDTHEIQQLQGTLGTDVLHLLQARRPRSERAALVGPCC